MTGSPGTRTGRPDGIGGLAAIVLRNWNSYARPPGLPVILLRTSPRGGDACLGFSTMEIPGLFCTYQQPRKEKGLAQRGVAILLHVVGAYHRFFHFLTKCDVSLTVTSSCFYLKNNKCLLQDISWKQQRKTSNYFVSCVAKK